MFDDNNKSKEIAKLMNSIKEYSYQNIHPVYPKYKVRFFFILFHLYME